MQEHILGFKANMKYYHDNPNLKDGGALHTAPDAVYELESLLNFTFCHTDIECNKKTFVTSEIIMPLDEIAKINDTKLAEVYYYKIIDTIQAQMERIDYQNMKLLLVDLEQTGTDSNGDAIVSIGALIGNEGTIMIPSSEYGWWYGFLGGTCDPNNNYAWDAAKDLQATINSFLVPAPPPGYIRKFSVLFTKEIFTPNIPLYRTENDVLDNYLDYKIFYASNSIPNFPITDDVKCVSTDIEIPFYLSSYTSIIDTIIEEQSGIQQINMSFIICIVDGRKDETETFIQHDFHFQIGRRWLVPDSIIIEDIELF